MNNICVTGGITAPPTFRVLSSGSNIWEARIAVPYGFGRNKGVNYLNVAVFGKYAETLSTVEFETGDHIEVVGELRIHQYGDGKWSHDIAANHIQLI